MKSKFFFFLLVKKDQFETPLKSGSFSFFKKAHEKLCLIDDNRSKLSEKHFSINTFHRVYEVKETLQLNVTQNAVKTLTLQLFYFLKSNNSK